MDLNLSPPDTNLEGNVLPHSMIWSIHPPTNHEIMVEQPNEYQRIHDKMPDWLAQLAARSNPHRAIE